MAIEHQKNLAVYILGVLLVAFAILQVYLSENLSSQQLRNINLIGEKDLTDVKQFEATTDTEAYMKCHQDVELLLDRITLLEQLSFDKLGPTDYAAHVFGGKVLSVFSTNRRSRSFLNRVRTMFSDNYHQMQCIIMNCGTCYAMEGSSGMVVLKLTKNVFLNGITIEHIPRSSLPAGQNEYSAMKEFTVWGTNDLGSEGVNIYLGTFTFDYTKTFLKTFALNWDSKMRTVRFVGVEIVSNHGKNYTCIYRIRIHGTPEE